MYGDRYGLNDEEKAREGIRYTIDIEAIPEEYAEVVRVLRADRQHDRRVQDPLPRPKRQPFDDGGTCELSL